MSNLLNTLAEREKRYGRFMENASTAQVIKDAMRAAPMWNELEWDQAEALDLIASKIGRMLSGDVNYIDNWHDVSGYATLVERRMNGDDVEMTATEVLQRTGDPRPKAPIGGSTTMETWSKYLDEVDQWERRNPLART